MEERINCKFKDCLHWKLYRRQINRQSRKRISPPKSCTIRLNSLLPPIILLKGHVFLGFSCDGRHLISYRCKIFTTGDFITPFHYKYIIYWWRFELQKPLKKIRKVNLFLNDDICQELLVWYCEPPHVDYVVVHAQTVGTATGHTSTDRISYVQIIPHSVDQATLNLCYELLSPFPPFQTSVNMNLPNTILLNSGDTIFAVMISQQGKCYCGSFDRTITEKITSSTREHLLERNSNQKYDFSVDSSLTAAKKTSTCEPSSERNSNNSSTAGTAASELCEEPPPSYLSFAVQGFTLPEDESAESQQSLPASPFNCLATMVMSCYVSAGNNRPGKLAFEHKCYQHKDKGELSDGVFVSQAQFDAENFINDQLKSDAEVYQRFISMRDFDVQIVQACDETNEVVILLNALLLLREEQSESCNESYDSRKISLHTIRFAVSWHVYTGDVVLLQKSNVLKVPADLSKTKSYSVRSFAPSLSHAVRIRSAWHTPRAKHALVHAVSNHTVFSGCTLSEIKHPLLPVTIVL